MSTNSRFFASKGSSSKVTKEERSADAKKAFLETLASASATVDADLKERATNLHSNSQVLNRQQKQLQKEYQAVSRESDETETWLNRSKKKTTAFDELISNEDQIDELDDDLDDLEAMLDTIEKKQGTT